MVKNLWNNYNYLILASLVLFFGMILVASV
ncbi:hypothetical protein [Psychrobacillus phage Perkons]|nr:hypothetical protein [Psychrobacillus phage Perkons]